MAKKINTRALSEQKRRRRQWLTFVRMLRYGVNNVSRNAWLTLAAAAIMTITLLVIFLTLAARNVLVDTVSEIESKVDMSVYVKTDVTADDAAKIQKSIEALNSVKSVNYTSPEEARREFAEQQKTEAGTLSALNEASNRFPGVFRVVMVDINDTSELENLVKTDATIKANLDPNRAPSFAGERRDAIKSIASWISFAQTVGLFASIVFIAISSLIVFNTIRMAIFNRRDEIQMMKLIGADRGFIRGPFVVEAIVYGFLAAVVSTAAGMALLYWSSEPLLKYGIVVDSTLRWATDYLAFVLLGMICVGALIGVVSSLLATRRYLKI